MRLLQVAGAKKKPPQEVTALAGYHFLGFGGGVGIRYVGLCDMSRCSSIGLREPVDGLGVTGCLGLSDMDTPPQFSSCSDTKKISNFLFLQPYLVFC